MVEKRMPITWVPPWLANVIGARKESWIEVGNEEIIARMGPLARVRFPRRLVQDARRIRWPWIFGFGIRIYGRRAVGLVGHRHEVVEMRLTHPVRARAVVPMWIDRLAVSVAEPERLISMVRPAKERATKAPRRRAANTRRAIAPGAATRPSRARPNRRAS